MRLPSQVPRPSRTVLRVGFTAVILVCAFLLVGSYLSYAGNAAATLDDQASKPYDQREQLVAPRDDITVMATQNTGNVRGSMLAFSADGRLLYFNDTYHNYHDIDPVPGTAATVEVLATRKFSDGACDVSQCIESVVERVNLTTGDVDREYSYFSHTATQGSSMWHDVDRINETHLVVADIALDRVFIVDIETGTVEWAWLTQSAYPLSAGGSFPGDWTHMNDVEYLPDGRVMVSVRNMDQVVFLEPGSGLQHDWTLGEDDDHDILYEQHNPDFIPAEDGGPAVVVADSENGRAVEYQREDGEWNRSWVWQDQQLQWPRDADRLPNGNTLITDSNGHRVVEVDPSGEVVWSVPLQLKIYEAERMGTGDESADGPSAQRAGLTSRTTTTAERSGGSVAGAVFGLLGAVIPAFVFNGLLFVFPAWFSLKDLFPFLGLVGVGGVWVVAELYWSPLSVAVSSPISIAWRRDDPTVASEPNPTDDD